jgi:serine/threonine protein kinase/tetratricopeptide (TPR) repeat protein
MDMLGTLFNHRYLLTSELGRGGLSVVYRAQDILLDRGVAVKVLSSTALGAESKNRLMHEARAAARLNHPHIIQVYDAGEAEGQPYIVMQLLEGKSLYEYKPDSLDEMLAIVRQICQALVHAHANGVIHRDLKPENVIITSDGRAILTDFGLARSVVSRISVEGAILGTVAYLSPEQALGQEIDGRTDLYALGVLLYELICQRLPFQAEDPLAVIAQHLYAPVVPPSTWRPDLPPALDALIVRLMSKRPEERPATAAEVLAVLEPLAAALSRPGEPSTRPGPSGTGFPKTEQPGEGELSPLDRLARGRLVGRERELAETKTLWRRAVLGESQVLLISGESGVGKTPLVHAVIALARVSGGRALVAECFPEGAAPYEPIAQILRVALEEPLALPDLVLADLLTLVPDQRPRFPAASSGSPAVLPGEQQRLFESVFALVAALAGRAPALLVVEDLQWADRGTLSMLRHLARRARFAGLRLCMVLTYRESELSETHELNKLLVDLSRERLAERIKLARFNREQTGELLAAMFQEQVSPAFLEAVYTETEGNLFFVEELCKTLIEEGRVRLENGHWRWAGPKEIELPQSVRMTIQARIARLPESAQEVLRLAAVFGREFDFETLKEAAEQDEETLINALEIAERAQLIAEAQPRQSPRSRGARERGARARAGEVLFAFEHALIPVTLRESLTSLRRHRLHRKAAAALEARHPEDYAALAYHFDQAGDEDCARRYYKLAGDQALSVYANQDAIHFYTEALSLVDPDDPAQFETLAARARAYDLTAQRQAQLDDARLMLALAEKTGAASELCDALLTLADAFLHTDHVKAREPAGRAAALARTAGDPVREGQALRRLGEEAWHSSNYPESRKLLEVAAQRFQEAGLPGEAAACLNLLSLVLGFQGMGEIIASQKAVEESLALSRQAGNRRQEGTSLRRLAIVYMDQFRHAEALPFAQAALALHQEIGDRGEVERALNVLGLIMGWLGRDDEAEGFFRQSLEIAEQAASVNGISNAAVNLCWINFVKRGNFGAALAFLDDLLKRVRGHENPLLAFTLFGQKTELLTSLGQFEAALRIVQAIPAQMGELLGPPEQAHVQALTGLLLAEMGERARFRLFLEAALELAGQVGRRLERAWVLNVFALAELADGVPESLRQGVQHAEEAAKLLSGTNWKFDLGTALRLAAELHLELGETERGLARSEEALRLVAGFPIPMEGYAYVQARALFAAGRPVEAAGHLRLACERVRLVARTLQDPALRQSWLTRVRINRLILAEAAARGLDSEKTPPEL